MQLTPMIAGEEKRDTTSPEDWYSGTVPLALRRKYGQFFTPEPIARFMVRWACRGGKVRSLLDPALGTGIFLRMYHGLVGANGSEKVSTLMRGYEIDGNVLRVALATLPPSVTAALDVREQDFLSAEEMGRFQAIVCNPPYFKHHRLPDKARRVQELRDRLGIGLRQTTSVYCLFLLKCLSLLEPAGRCAFITPSEFLNSDYGVAVKEYLLGRGLLKCAVLFDPREPVFADAITTATITLCENSIGGASGTPLLLEIPAGRPLQEALDEVHEITTTGDGEGQPRLVGVNTRIVRLSHAQLDPTRKWQPYMSVRPQVSAGLPLLPLARYTACVRGIATGANQFFLLSGTDAGTLGLTHADLLPCVGRAQHVEGYVFTKQAFERLLASGRRCLLLNLGQVASTAARRYITRGEEIGIQNRYLTKHRRPWYSQEKRPAADFWVPVFFREKWRVVLNEARVSNLTAFHGLYLNLEGRSFARELFLYLNSGLCRELMASQVRTYGRGLSKLEPKDVGRIPTPDFATFPHQVLHELRALYDGLLCSRLGQPATAILSRADEVLRDVCAVPPAGPNRRVLQPAQDPQERLVVEL